MSPSDDSEREDLEAMRLLDETLLVARAAKKKSRIRRTRKMIRMSRDDADETARRICSCREDRQAAGLQSAQKHILLSDLRSTRTQNESLSPATLQRSAY
jgi:hypothetical protein